MIEILVIASLLIIFLAYLTLKKPNNDNTSSNVYSAEYYRGLNYLLNNEDDKALKIFTDLIDVDSSTIETHLALGGVYRRRGEFDKAILIHQNLLSRPKLDKSIKNQSLYELSKDFFSAGLYDKSERILLNLKENQSYQESCIEYLLLIYELSKDWDSAISFSKNLKQERVRNTNINVLTSQYYCEKSVVYQNDNQLNKSITVLRKAIDVNNNCTRAFSMLFKLNTESNPALALDNLRALVKINSTFLLILAKDILKLSVTHQNKDIDMKIYSLILEESKPNQFSPDLYEFMFNINAYDSPKEYVSKVSENMFTNIYDNLYNKKNNDQPSNSDLLRIIKENYMLYSCNNCGYTAKSHVWQCPSCNRWETIEINTINERVNINE